MLPLPMIGSMAVARVPTGARGASIVDVTDEWPTLAEVVETLTFRAGYNAALVVGGTTLLGVAAGVVGVFALLRKRALVADAVSHAALPGIALAFLIAGALGFEGRSLGVLLSGAALTGVLGAACVQWLLWAPRVHEDAAIGIVLSVFFGAGVVGLSYIQANAGSGSAGLRTFIYGQAAAMSPSDVAMMAGIAGVAFLAAALLLKEFAVVCFNDAFARVQGWPVGLIDGVMLALVVLVTVAGLQSVGLVLVIALLIIPPVSARFWTERLWALVLLAGLIGGLSGYLGSVMSALLPRKPAGAVIVLTSGALFAVSLLVAPSRGVLASGWRRLRLRLRIASDHVLEEAHERGRASLSRAELAGLWRARGWSRFGAGAVLWWLGRQGLLESSDGGVRLTEAGRTRGARVSRNHALWEAYLVRYADVAPSHVDWSVDQVEHVLSEELVRELERDLARGRAAGS